MDVISETVAICILIFVLVLAFATCLTVSIGAGDPLFSTFGASGARDACVSAAVCPVLCRTKSLGDSTQHDSA
jgi:hypothetical protein